MTLKNKSLWDSGQGIRLLYIPSNEETGISIRVNAGSLDDIIAGCAHFCEHLLMTAPVPDDEGAAFMDVAAKACTFVKAFTWYTYTQFTFLMDSEQNNFDNIDEFLGFVLQHIFQADLAQAPFHDEKEYFLQELKDRQEHDNRMTRFIKTVFHTSILERPVAGDMLHAKQLSFDDCTHFYQSIFLKRPVDIMVTGKADFEKLQKLVQHALGSLPRAKSSPQQAVVKGFGYEDNHILLPNLGHLHTDYDYGSIWQNILLAKFVSCLEKEQSSLDFFAPAFLDLGLSAVSLWECTITNSNTAKIKRLLTEACHQVAAETAESLFIETCHMLDEDLSQANKTYTFQQQSESPYLWLISFKNTDEEPKLLQQTSYKKFQTFAIEMKKALS